MVILAQLYAENLINSKQPSSSVPASSSGPQQIDISSLQPLMQAITTSITTLDQKFVTKDEFNTKIATILDAISKIPKPSPGTGTGTGTGNGSDTGTGSSSDLENIQNSVLNDADLINIIQALIAARAAAKKSNQRGIFTGKFTGDQKTRNRTKTKVKYQHGGNDKLVSKKKIKKALIGGWIGIATKLASFAIPGGIPAQIAAAGLQNFAPHLKNFALSKLQQNPQLSQLVNSPLGKIAQQQIQSKIPPQYRQMYQQAMTPQNTSIASQSGIPQQRAAIPYTPRGPSSAIPYTPRGPQQMPYPPMPYPPMPYPLMPYPPMPFPFARPPYYGYGGENSSSSSSDSDNEEQLIQQYELKHQHHNNFLHN